MDWDGKNSDNDIDDQYNGGDSNGDGNDDDNGDDNDDDEMTYNRRRHPPRQLQSPLSAPFHDHRSSTFLILFFVLFFICPPSSLSSKTIIIAIIMGTSCGGMSMTEVRRSTFE